MVRLQGREALLLPLSLLHSAKAGGAAIPNLRPILGGWLGRFMIRSERMAGLGSSLRDGLRACNAEMGKPTDC